MSPPLWRHPLAVAGLVALAALAASSEPALATVPASAPEISVEGRAWTMEAGALRLGHPGITVRIHFSGTKLVCHSRTDSDELFLDVSLDGGPAAFVHVPKGDSAIALIDQAAAGEHQLEITKRVESCVAVWDFLSVVVDGALLAPPPLPPRRLLFIGDSFTCGQAATVRPGLPIDPSKAHRENARLSYGKLLARELDAQVHLVAYAGRGLLRDWQGLTAGRFPPEYYGYTLPDDPSTPWNPRAYVPDVIGVCLGTNDFGAGIPPEEEYITAYVAFVRQLRRDAPAARILLLGSPILQDRPGEPPLRSLLLAHLGEVVRRLGDARVEVIPLAAYPVVPGDWHPDGVAHEAVAAQLAGLLRGALP